MPYDQAREACNRLLVELDEDIRDYIIDMLGGDESEEEMKAAVTDFLVSTEHCADEDEATIKVTELFASLSAATPTDPATLNAELRILDSTVSLAASADDKLFREKVQLTLPGPGPQPGPNLSLTPTLYLTPTLTGRFGPRRAAGRHRRGPDDPQEAEGRARSRAQGDAQRVPAHPGAARRGGGGTTKRRHQRRQAAAAARRLHRCGRGQGLLPAKPGRRSRVKVPALAVPERGCCASSGRAWRLWAARHSQRKRPSH